jgi:hypothetical protein
MDIHCFDASRQVVSAIFVIGTASEVVRSSAGGRRWCRGGIREGMREEGKDEYLNFGAGGC